MVVTTYLLLKTLLAQAERQAVNTKIQGSAADLVKSALILLNRTLEEKLANVHLVHQIHDELQFQVSEVVLIHNHMHLKL